jgi:hypothetical protein
LSAGDVARHHAGTGPCRCDRARGRGRHRLHGHNRVCLSGRAAKNSRLGFRAKFATARLSTSLCKPLIADGNFGYSGGTCVGCILLSTGYQKVVEEDTAGEAAGEAAGKSAYEASRAVSGRSGGVTQSGSMGLPVYPGGPGDPALGDPNDRTAAELARDEQVRKFYKGRSPIGGTVASATAKTGREHAVFGLETTSGKQTFRLGQTAVEKPVNGELLGEVEAVIPAHDPEKWKVSFQAHTHPDQPGGQYMSNADLYVGRAENTYVYVLQPGGRTMLCFDPVKDAITILPGVNK